MNRPEVLRATVKTPAYLHAHQLSRGVDVSELRDALAGLQPEEATVLAMNLGEVSVGNGDAPSEFVDLLVVTRTFFQLMAFASESIVVKDWPA
jgi:hypothetical protein